MLTRARLCRRAAGLVGTGTARSCRSLPPIAHNITLPVAPSPPPHRLPPPPAPPHLSFRCFCSSVPDGTSSSSVIAIKNDSEYVSALNLAQEKEGIAVVYFTAKWCGPCKMVSPVVDELSTKYDNATFLKVDIDEEKLQDVVSDQKITSVPTFRFFRGGKSVGEVIGANVKALKDKVAALLGK